VGFQNTFVELEAQISQIERDMFSFFEVLYCMFGYQLSLEFPMLICRMDLK
jgi:hypothetical protein